MRFDRRTVVLVAMFAVTSATSARADDCAQPKAAMLVSAQTPYRETIVAAGPGGKAATSHMIQTATMKYVEKDGVWKSLPVTSADLVETLNETFKTGKITCKRIGTEQVNGQSATVYTVHLEHEGHVTDGTLWISSSNHQLKSDTTTDGRHFTATFDYDHVQPPAGATSAAPRRP